MSHIKERYECSNLPTEPMTDSSHEPIFLTLFPANFGVQIATVLACSERFGFFPTHLLVHPERYAWCEQKVLYIPYPQESVQSTIELMAFIASKEGGQKEDSSSPLPPLEVPALTILRVGVCADPSLKWYQIRCVCNPT